MISCENRNIQIRIKYCRLQAYELVIKSYPASGNIIDDMRFCMESNGGYGRENLVEKLSNDVKTHLLHIGKIFEKNFIIYI